MSKSFLPTRRENPCPLCGDTRGKCRENPTVHLCMTFAEAESIPGFKFLGRTTDNLWGKWIADDGQSWTEQQRQDWQREKERRLAAESKLRAEAMPAEERDRDYRRLLDQLTLHPADRADLMRRGLSPEQIKSWGVKSVEQWQSLEGELPHTLSGVGLDGRSLNVSGAGYLCPIWNVEGLLVGFQLRLRETDSGRYRWLTSATKKRPHGATPHLPNGELPLAIHRPLEVSRKAIALVEGTGPKPLILSQQHGVVTIGAAGGQFASSPQTLQHSLEVLSAELETQVIEFYPDAGAVFNRQVLRQYRATWKLLRQWGYEIRVAWWGQETKSTLDIDELDSTQSIEWITTAQFEVLAHPRFDWLEQLQQTLKRQTKPLESALSLRRRLGEGKESEKDVVSYGKDDRLQTWQQAISQGYRYILDRSATGTGKSFDAGNTVPEQLSEAAGQIIYLSDQHRNPTVETLAEANGWLDLEARHSGLIREAAPGGGTRLKRVGKGETPSIPTNCTRTQTIGALRTKQIQGADTAALICGTCPLREACTHAEGAGYGFLHQRRVALSSPKLRAHPDSLTPPTEYDYAGTLLLWDEPGQSFVTKREIRVTVMDLEQTLMTLLPLSDLLASVQDFLAALLFCLDGQLKLGRFGLSHSEVVQQLPIESLAVDIPVLEQALRPDLSFLNTTATHGVDLADLPAHLRKRFSEKDGEMAEQAQQRVIKQWLPDLLRVLMGQQAGVVRLESGGLILSLADIRHRTIAQATKATVFLDATLHRTDLALKLGCQPEEILVCQQQVEDHGNLALTQVVDLGRMGMQRGADQKQRAAAIVAHYQALDSEVKVIDFKRFAEVGMGVWWRDSRGVNDFTETKTLILVGTPCRNLADLQAEFAILTGKEAAEAEEAFKEFVDRVILADFQQAIGRLRFHRRGEEKLEVVLLSNFPLDINTQQVKASDITLEAAGKFERFLLAVQQAGEHLKQAGEKVTQRAIAELTEYSQSYISRFWKLLQTLLGFSNSKSNQAGPPVPDEILEMAQAAIELCQDPQQVLESVEDIFFGWLHPGQRRQLYQQLSGQVQVRVVMALLLTLPGEKFQMLEA